MSNFKWSIAKAAYTKEFPDGTLKRVLEHYIVSSMSFTDAEATMYEQLGEFVKGEFFVKSITPIDIADLFQYDDSDVWYKIKVEYLIEDADTGKEKTSRDIFFVTARSINQANERVAENLKELLVSYRIVKSEETPIQEVYLHSNELEGGSYDEQE